MFHSNDENSYIKQTSNGLEHICRRNQIEMTQPEIDDFVTKAKTMILVSQGEKRYKPVLISCNNSALTSR